MNDRGQASAEARYLIGVRGVLDESWSDWFGGVEVALEQAVDGSPVTLLTGMFDHSTPHGILARSRDLNLTLISVSQVESDAGQGGE